MTATHVIERTAREDRDVRVRTRKRPPHTLSVPTRLHDSPPFRHDPVVLAAIEGHQGALNAATALVDRVEDTYWTLAGVLYEIDRTGAYRDADCQDFKEYAERELGIGYQKARQFVQFYRTFRALNIDHQRLARIGWTKVRDIGRLVGQLVAKDDLGDSLDEIMAYAEEHNRADTVEHIKSTYISASAERVREIKFVVRATGSAADMIDRAMERAKRQMEGPGNNSLAIEWICGEWSNDTEGFEMTLEEAVNILFRRFGEEAVLAHFRERSLTN